MRRTPQFAPAYFPPHTFGAQKPLPNVTLLESMTVDLTGQDSLPDGLSTLQGVLAVARREAEQGAFTLRQLCNPAIIDELKASTGRLRGAHPAAMVRHSLRELRLMGAVDYHDGVRSRYVLANAFLL
ncbi:hypothetical protein TrLO_g12618 [Triparma laevis f. longispina]|uniref:Uncharacterized protein n=1 Tax=Triparma laevis f. longispina TaxID=1714387 RepID=A0A9W7B0V8_9STRA|nr:hypothetical protein TrLO_g12618 [Triparma laevis f. longispina]